MAGTERSRPAVRCKSCGKKISATAPAGGRPATCPECNAPMVAPKAPRSAARANPAAAAPPGEELIRFDCEQCGARLKMQPSTAGRRAKCPKCGAVLTVPLTGAPTAGSPVGADHSGHVSSPDNHSGQAVSAPAAVHPDASVVAGRCPNCGIDLRPGVVLCVACGTNLQTGEQHQLAAGTGRPDVASVRGVPECSEEPGPSLLRGCIGSAVGAALGAGAWIACALYTQHELAWLAILLGGLTGLGMYWGHRDTSFSAGLAAAAIALAAILGARTIILHVLFEPAEGLVELTLNVLLATGLWGLLFIGIAMFMAFKVGASGPSSFDDD